MRKWFSFMPTILLFYGFGVQAGVLDYFKNEDGSTKWQYVANFSSSVLILLLSIAAIKLFLSHRSERRANRQLQEIKDALELRVQERTATLNESNRLLQQSKQALEGEIGQHKETMVRLEESEAYVKSILDSMPLMLIGLNKDLIVTQWNAWAETTTGIRSDGVLGKNLWEVYPTITLSPDQVRDVLQQKKTVTIKHSQRGQYYFDITLYSLQGNKDTGIVILVDDITQQSKAENMLIQRDKMSSMGELAATVAYDINAPLQTILTDMQVAKNMVNSKDDFVEDRQQLTSLLESVEKSGCQASTIISNLLHFSRSEGDEKQLSKIPDIIDHSIELAESLLSDISGLKFKDILIERDYQQSLSEIPAYVSELQQVFLSLFRHACHAIGKIGRKNFKPTITIEVKEFYGALWVKVQHNGKGLTAEEQMNLFEPFFQGRSEKDGENQVGRLSFSHFIITEHHRGQMAVSSDINIGTTFHIQFQLR